MRSVEDLLFRLPLRYEDRRSFARIAELREGMKVAVAGVIAAAGVRRARRISLFEIRLEDASGRLKALWFNQPYLKDVLVRGRRVVLYGAVERDAFGGGRVMMSSPEHELLEEADAPGVHTGRIVPVYEKLGPLGGKALRRVLAGLAAAVGDDLADALPERVRERLGVVGRGEALRRVHLPGADDSIESLNGFRSPAHLRLILEELFLFQLGLARRRRGLHGTRKGIAFAIDERTRAAARRVLPFALTGAQQRVLREIVGRHARRRTR